MALTKEQLAPRLKEVEQIAGVVLKERLSDLESQIKSAEQSVKAAKDDTAFPMQPPRALWDIEFRVQCIQFKCVVMIRTRRGARAHVAVGAKADLSTAVR